MDYELPATDYEEQEEKIPRCNIPTDRKYTIGITEAAAYYGIGEKRLRQIVADHPNGEFFIEIGRHVLIKRRQFEAFLDNSSCL